VQKKPDALVRIVLTQSYFAAAASYNAAMTSRRDDVTTSRNRRER